MLAAATGGGAPAPAPRAVVVVVEVVLCEWCGRKGATDKGKTRVTAQLLLRCGLAERHDDAALHVLVAICTASFGSICSPRTQKALVLGSKLVERAWMVLSHGLSV